MPSTAQLVTARRQLLAECLPDLLPLPVSTPIYSPRQSAPQFYGSTPVKRLLLIVSVILIAIFCAAGAVWTAYWSLRFGLAPRPPLSLPQTVLRFAVVAFASVLLVYRRDWIERSAFLCAIVAAGSSALFGLGVRSTILDIVRLLFHFVAYALGFAACVRWLIRQVRDSQPPFVVR